MIRSASWWRSKGTGRVPLNRLSRAVSSGAATWTSALKRTGAKPGSGKIEAVRPSISREVKSGCSDCGSFAIRRLRKPRAGSGRSQSSHHTCRGRGCRIAAGSCVTALRIRS